MTKYCLFLQARSLRRMVTSLAQRAVASLPVVSSCPEKPARAVKVSFQYLYEQSLGKKSVKFESSYL